MGLGKWGINQVFQFATKKQFLIQAVCAKRTNKLKNDMRVLIVLCAFVSLAAAMQEREEYSLTKELELCASQGDVKSKYKIAICYLLGKGVSVDFKKAWDTFADCRVDLEKLSKEGDVDATKMLADYFANGRGKEGKDYVKARGLYYEASKKNDPEALFKLGEMYENGWGTTKDDQQALSYYKKASETMYGPACYNIAKILFDMGDKNKMEQVFRTLEKNKEAAKEFLSDYDKEIQKLDTYDETYITRIIEIYKKTGNIMPPWLHDYQKTGYRNLISEWETNKKLPREVLEFEHSDSKTPHFGDPEEKFRSTYGPSVQCVNALSTDMDHPVIRKYNYKKRNLSVYFFEDKCAISIEIYGQSKGKNYNLVSSANKYNRLWSFMCDNKQKLLKGIKVSKDQLVQDGDILLYKYPKTNKLIPFNGIVCWWNMDRVCEASCLNGILDGNACEIIVGNIIKYFKYDKGVRTFN